MCQSCVGDGRMTQQELDQATLDGDPTVVPILLLSREQMLDAVAEVATEAVLDGLPYDEAMVAARQVMAEYDKIMGAS